jgi:hypothetical protein
LACNQYLHFQDDRKDFISIQLSDLLKLMSDEILLDDVLSPDLTSWKHISLDSSPLIRLTSQSSNDMLPRGITLLRHAYGSTPDIQSYNVLVGANIY